MVNNTVEGSTAGADLLLERARAASAAILDLAKHMNSFSLDEENYGSSEVLKQEFVPKAVNLT